MRVAFYILSILLIFNGINSYRLLEDDASNSTASISSANDDPVPAEENVQADADTDADEGRRLEEEYYLDYTFAEPEVKTCGCKKARNKANSSESADSAKKFENQADPAQEGEVVAESED